MSSFMPKRIVTARLKKIILQEKKKKPYLSVRKLSQLIRIRHKVEISKSTIFNILKREVKTKKGRKKSLSFYQGRTYPQAGLALLLSFDSQVGLFESLSRQLKVYFPRLSNLGLLDKFLVIGSFLTFLGRDLKELKIERGLLRLAGLQNFSLRRFRRFEERLSKFNPRLDLQDVKNNLSLVSGIRFSFKNGYQGFSDPRLSTFWGGICQIPEFFLPLKGSWLKVEKMLEQGLIVIAYTKSFDYISPLALDFLEGFESGLKEIDFLNKKGEVLKKREISETAKLKIITGFYPSRQRKGMVFQAKGGSFKSFSCFGLPERYICGYPVEVSDSGQKRKLNLESILVRKKTFSFSSWGILTNQKIKNKKELFSAALRRYLYFFPYPEESFKKDIKIIENSFLLPAKKEQFLENLVPSRLSFKKLDDLSWIAQILAVMFKEFIPGYEPKGKKGAFRVEKECLKVFLPSVSSSLRKKFNNYGFYIREKRVYMC